MELVIFRSVTFRCGANLRLSLHSKTMEMVLTKRVLESLLMNITFWRKVSPLSSGSTHWLIILFLISAFKDRMWKESRKLLHYVWVVKPFFILKGVVKIQMLNPLLISFEKNRVVSAVNEQEDWMCEVCLLKHMMLSILLAYFRSGLYGFCNYIFSL